MKKKYKILITILSIILILFVFINIPESKKKIQTENFTFLFSNGIDQSSIVELSEVLEESYSKISTNLNTTPAKNIEVNIYSQRWRYIKATGHWSASGSVEGTSKLHFLENVWLDTEISKITVHEFVHAVVLKFLIDNEPQPLDVEKFDEKFAELPVWIWEGVSVYEANTLEYFKNGKFPQLLELNTRSKGQKIYTCGYTIIEYILKEYGRDKLINLIESYGDLENTFNVSEEQFTDNWHEFVKEKYLDKV